MELFRYYATSTIPNLYLVLFKGLGQYSPLLVKQAGMVK